MDLVTNGGVITDVLNYVNNKTKELSEHAEKKLLQDIKDKEEVDTEDIEVANKELATEIKTEHRDKNRTTTDS